MDILIGVVIGLAIATFIGGILIYHFGKSIRW